MQGSINFFCLPDNFPLIYYGHIIKTSYFAIGMILRITVYFLVF